MNLAFPKPKDQKKYPIPVRVFKDGREACNLLIKAGKDEYARRIREMWERQGKMCCLYGRVEGCPGKLALAEATFEHEAGRGHGGGHRDDRILVNGKYINGAAHFICNSKKGSVRIDYNSVP